MSNAAFLLGLLFSLTFFSGSFALVAPNAKNNNKRKPVREFLTERTVVILFHKPRDVITSHLSDGSRSTVYDVVKSMKGFIGRDEGNKDNQNLSFEQVTRIYSKLHAIGRLDADTSGLLLLTNDGALIHHVTNPNATTHTSKHGAITKTYEALVMGRHDEESLKTLWQGVDIGAKHGGITQPVNDLKILEHPDHKSTIVSITISEGKNRQIRRMFHALGSGVMKLKRTHIGTKLSLEGLMEGQWRILSDKEVRESLHWEPRNGIHSSSSGSEKAFPRTKTLIPSKEERNKRHRRRKNPN